MVPWRSGSLLVAICALSVGCGSDPCSGSQRGAVDPTFVLQGQSPVGNPSCTGDNCCLEPRWKLLESHADLEALMSNQLAGASDADWKGLAWNPDDGWALAVWHPSCPTPAHEVEVTSIRERNGEVEIGVCTTSRDNAGKALIKPWTVVGLPGLKPDTIALDFAPTEVD